MTNAYRSWGSWTRKSSLPECLHGVPDRGEIHVERGAANHCAFAFGRANLDSGVDGAVTAVGYAPEEIATHESTRSARLKWVVVVDNAVPVGRMVKAVAWPPRARVRRSPICSDPVGLTRPGDSTSVCRGRGAPCWPPIRAVSPRFEYGQMASDVVRVADMPRSRRPTGLRRVRGRTCRDETRGSGRLCRQHHRAPNQGWQARHKARSADPTVPLALTASGIGPWAVRRSP
jgi:hypothetical protein